MFTALLDARSPAGSRSAKPAVSAQNFAAAHFSASQND